MRMPRACLQAYSAALTREGVQVVGMHFAPATEAVLLSVSGAAYFSGVCVYISLFCVFKFTYFLLHT